MRLFFVAIILSCSLFGGSNSMFAVERSESVQLTIDSLTNRIAILERSLEYQTLTSQYSTLMNDLEHCSFNSKILLLELENTWQDVKYDSRKRDYKDRQILDSHQQLFDSYKELVDAKKQLYANLVVKDFLVRQKFNLDETEINLLNAQITSINVCLEALQKGFDQITLYLKELKRYH